MRRQSRQKRNNNQKYNRKQLPSADKNLNIQPWQAWLSCLEHRPQTKGLLVPCLVRAHTWISGSMPGRRSPVWVCAGGNQSMFLSHIDVSVSPFLSPFFSLSKSNEKYVLT